MLSLFLVQIVLHGFLAKASLVTPTVTLDSAIVTGLSVGNVEKFLGIPFAQPPTGNLRFNLPQPIPAYSSDFSALEYGPSCPQQSSDPLKLPGNLNSEVDDLFNSLFSAVLPDDEDCLTINVIKPASASTTSNLPVLVWIFGGGFELGGTSITDGTSIVERSIELKEPVIYISMNYRVSAFGFLASQEVKDAKVGNLGLQDQREAFRWVQKYIKAFGGDPTKVTIWGESAGAISASLHMLANGGDPQGLFRAAFMESGSPISLGDITNGQKYYDQLVHATGCSESSDSLECLRSVPYPRLKAAVDATPNILEYQSLQLAWLPRVDGVFLSDNPQTLVKKGKVASIPIVSGNCDDEGTLFALASLNVTSETALREYIETTLIPNVSDSQVSKLLKLYPEDVTQGSPFDTGILNVITPENKRIAALLGDMAFQGPRRFFLQSRVGKQPIWSFINKRLKGLPILGSAHGTDLLNVYGSSDMTDFLIHFSTTLDPNGHADTLFPRAFFWPEYSDPDFKMVQFNDNPFERLSISQDDYRRDGIEYLIELFQDHPS
ncbi:hypothetical protein GYMLUDRAFT_243065 [Collybiopsis luxurians FD-317 M1]|uniref:Carboxylic ester hydrolase n=1 Tax=Collybiopsis luxurians FD-317 M1 TaxID=944289 RepID=A0A0D0CGX5_9AGAR|nr:hypothetical protein GYMLUDRAFT_243065 [Collybiopsis luxurians FD-317 M1]